MEINDKSIQDDIDKFNRNRRKMVAFINERNNKRKSVQNYIYSLSLDELKKEYNKGLEYYNSLTKNTNVLEKSINEYFKYVPVTNKQNIEIELTMIYQRIDELEVKDMSKEEIIKELDKLSTYYDNASLGYESGDGTTQYELNRILDKMSALRRQLDEIDKEDK